MTVFEAEQRAFADDWALQDKAQSTVEAYCAQLRKYDSWCLANELQTTTVRAAKRYLVERSKDSQWTAFYVSRAIKAFGKWWACEYQATDPFEQLSYVKQPKPKHQRTTTAADVDAMLAVCGDDFRGIRDRALIHTFASTGMRRSEVARMMWDDMNMGSGTIVVPKVEDRAASDREAQQGRPAGHEALLACPGPLGDGLSEGPVSLRLAEHHSTCCADCQRRRSDAHRPRSGGWGRRGPPMPSVGQCCIEPSGCDFGVAYRTSRLARDPICPVQVAATGSWISRIDRADRARSLNATVPTGRQRR
jgi:hypothetical protein